MFRAEIPPLPKSWTRLDGCDEGFVADVDTVARQPEEELDVAGRAGQRARDRADEPQPQLPRRRGDVPQLGEPQRGIANDATTITIHPMTTDRRWS